MLGRPPSCPKRTSLARVPAGTVNADFVLEHDERRVARAHGEHGERLSPFGSRAGALAGDDLGSCRRR